MTIKLQDRNLIVSYIQILLRDYFGVSLTSNISSNDSLSDIKYNITLNNPIRVTGDYNIQTYLSSALYMAFNYPNELFPIRYDIGTSSTELLQTSFDQDKLKYTMDKVLDYVSKSTELVKITEEWYNQVIVGEGESKDTKVFNWSTLLKYFADDNEDNIQVKVYDMIYQGNTEYSKDDINESLVVFLSHNLSMVTFYNEVADINERIISYMLNEVVTPISEPDEVTRAQKLIYPEGIGYDRAGKYDGQMIDDVSKVQSDFISSHTNKDGVVSLPEGFSGFKVTGYVDPWTELIINSNW